MNALAELRYSVVIAWSDEDQAYIASFPDLPTLPDERTRPCREALAKVIAEYA